MINVTERGDVAFVRFVSTITISAFNLSALIEQNTEKVKVAVDMSTVHSLDSGSLGKIVMAHKVLAKKGGGMALFNLSPDNIKLMQMARVDKTVSICDAEEDALHRLSEANPSATG